MQFPFRPNDGYPARWVTLFKRVSRFISEGREADDGRGRVTTLFAIWTYFAWCARKYKAAARVKLIGRDARVGGGRTEPFDSTNQTDDFSTDGRRRDSGLRWLFQEPWRYGAAALMGVCVPQKATHKMAPMTVAPAMRAGRLFRIAPLASTISRGVTAAPHFSSRVA